MMRTINIHILACNHKEGQSRVRKHNVNLKLIIEKIQELKKKKNEQEEWDKYTSTQKSSVANIDEKIAKNLADEVLRNYPNMKSIHSNVSIRKLL